jgi:DNA-binding PadR family transcriptional regulator
MAMIVTVERVDLLGRREVAILDAVHRGAMRSRPCAGQVRALVDEPAGEALLHDTLRRFEEAGLLRSSSQTAGRIYTLTAAGQSRLRAQRRFERALLGLLARSDRAERLRRENLSASVRQATADHAH